MGSGGGGAGGAGPSQFTYTFHGDPRATFAQFFGSSNPFESFFNMGPGGNRPFHFGGEGEDMDVDDPFINLGLGGRHPGGAFRSQSFNMHGPGMSKEKVQDPPIEYDLHITLEDVLKGKKKSYLISFYLSAVQYANKSSETDRMHEKNENFTKNFPIRRHIAY